MHIFGDSQLVVKQLAQEYKCVSYNLTKYCIVASKLLKKFDEVIIEHIPRNLNEDANELAQLASGYKVSPKVLSNLMEIRELLYPLEERDVLQNDVSTNKDWRQPILSYLDNPSQNVDRKLKLKASKFVVLGGALYRKSVDGNLETCLSEKEAYMALAEVHEGICGAHQAGDKMKWILRRQRYYWPTLVKDCIMFAKSCEECQRHGHIQNVPASELHSIIKPWPFRGWALDLIGQIHPVSSKGHKYILVGVNYFSKWVEAIALKEVTQQDVIDFIENNIVCRFGIPQTLTADQGTFFVGKKILEYANSRNIKMITSTPYYAQANGQVEAMNKIIISLIKKHIGQQTRNWHNTLNQILWAYRNSPRESTGTSPYKLVYGHDAMLLVEISLGSVRIQKQDELPVEHYWDLMFDELNELSDERLIALENMIRQKERAARFYDSRVKYKSFKVNDLVWKVILPLDKSGQEYGKWSPKWEGPFKVVRVFSRNAYALVGIDSNLRIKSINGKYLEPYRPTICEVKIDRK